ncbi:MAG: hypothetical protein ABI361_02030 [Nitrososphaera sp.]|jgi:uncharacterized protein (DUF1778 family)
MKRIPIELHLTEGQYEVLQDIARHQNEDIQAYVTSAVLSSLDSDLDIALSPQDEPYKQARAKLDWPPKNRPSLRRCIVCFGEEGTLVQYSNGPFTGSWLVHPACRHTQRSFGEANFHFRV